MTNRNSSDRPLRNAVLLTVRRCAGLLLAALVIDGVVGFDDQRLLARPDRAFPRELALEVVQVAAPAIPAVDGWSPTTQDTWGLLGAVLLGTVTIAATRIRRGPRSDRDTRGPAKHSAVRSRAPLLSTRPVSARPIRVLELRSIKGTGGGPEKTILLGARPEAGSRVHVTVCYLRDKRDKIFNIDRRAAEIWIDYVEILERHSFDPSVWSGLARLIREKQIDIVHAHDYKTNLLALLAGRLGLATPLSTAHGWNPSTRRETALYYPADKRLLAAFPRVIAVSSLIRDELIGHGTSPDNISVILNGIDAGVFTRRRAAEAHVRARLGVRPDQVVLGTIGRLAPEKDFGSLLYAFAGLRRRIENLVLFIVGDGPERHALQRLAAELELGDACRFLGQQSNVVEIHHALDLFVQSSLTEGTPNVVLEAMAMETPIVATSAGGTCELVQDGVHALIVPPGDRAALERAMRTAIEDRGAAAARAALARARVETDLSFDGRRRAVEAIYERLLTDGRRQASWLTELAPSA